MNNGTAQGVRSTDLQSPRRQTITIENGSLAAPSLSFETAPTTGFYYTATTGVAPVVNFALNGVQAFALNTTSTTLLRARLTIIGQMTLNGGGTITENTSFQTLSLLAATYDGSTVTSPTFTYLLSTSNTLVNNSAALTGITGINFSPNIQTSAGVGTITTVLGGEFSPTLLKTGTTMTVTDLIGLRVRPANNATFAADTCTNVTAIQIDGTNVSGAATMSGTITARGIHMKATWPGGGGSATKWALAFDTTIASYLAGALTMGGTTAPTWNAHVQGGNAAVNGLGIDVSTTGPTIPGSSAAGVLSFYKGATNWYFLITFNDAGTTRYKYLQMNATGVTWVNNTVLPT